MKIISNGVKKLIPQSIKNIYHLFQAVFANVWFGFPSRRLKVIGVTGTNGKTTTVQMIAKILEEAGFPVKPDGHGASKVAVASTINFKIGEREWVNATKLTTLSIFGLQKHLREAVKEGCDYAVIEITSHALDQNRAWGTDFDAAVITNITREHLDYHRTMEEYAKAKEKLFAMLGKAGKSGKLDKKISVVNLNMDFVEEFLKYPADEKYGYCLRNQESRIKNQGMNIVRAENIKLEIDQSAFTILDSQFLIRLPGEFNIENALAATCVGLSQNISLEKIAEALAKMKGVPGRMERIENDRGLEIIVDYAVTPDSLHKLYDYISKLKKEGSRIIAVFGACGERDRGKRPIMGRIIAKIADYVFITNEDPYNEDPQQIINEVFAGVSNYRKENMNTWRILDRREAIKKALQIAKSGDIVVVTGKGAEETMAIGNKMIPWNDPRIIREVLQKLG